MRPGDSRPCRERQSQISANQSPAVATGWFRRVADRRLCFKNNFASYNRNNSRALRVVWAAISSSETP
jgi:hypothetical protein